VRPQGCPVGLWGGAGTLAGRDMCMSCCMQCCLAFFKTWTVAKCLAGYVLSLTAHCSKPYSL
jgi:hypothetical protein